MAAELLQCALFPLCVHVDAKCGWLEFKDWTAAPAAQNVRVSIDENAILNSFWQPTSMQAVVDATGIERKVIESHVARLRSVGLLQTIEEWSKIRAAHPYSNLQTPARAVPSSGKYASYDDAYANDAVPWNDLPVASEVVTLTAALGGRQHPKVLDVGCGSGHNLTLITELGFDCWGIDISETAIRRLHAKGGANERFVAGDVTDLPWPDGSFDAVVDIGCLHCLAPTAVPQYVREVRRVLGKGGRFVCRAFKPRNAAMVDAQPVDMAFLGYHPDDFLALFEDEFPVRLVKEAPVHGIYVGEVP